MTTKKGSSKKREEMAQDEAIHLESLATTKESLEKSFNRHLHLSLARDRFNSTNYDHYLALAYTVRDRLIDRWINTQQTYYAQDVRRIYYISLEWLIGRTLGNSILNLDIEKEISEVMDDLGLELEELREAEVDAGLGNGGLGRLAACFIDSMATLGLPACGYGIRYEYGMFHQSIEDGAQKENPDNWLRLPYPWEIARPERSIPVNFNGQVETFSKKRGRTRHKWETQDQVLAVPYDTPVPGYNNNTVNNLRLWSAQSAEEFGLDYFNNGDYMAAIGQMEMSGSISKVLYPNDTSMNGKELRLKQQFFLCSASLQDIIKRYLKTHDNLSQFSDKVVIQLNDTHPAISIPELMRLLMDDEGMDWDTAWGHVQRTFAYTNHTLLPEALEKWPVFMFEKMLPRHLQIIYEINQRFLRQVSMRWPGDAQKLSSMSIIEEQPEKSVRMAFLSIVGSFSVNGVAALHTKLLKEQLFRDFYELSPEKFNNKTNGVTQRRWLRKSNPELSDLITSKIGDGWVRDLEQLRGLEKFATDKLFRKEWRKVKDSNKRQLADVLRTSQGAEIDPSTLFDVQVKRIHEYKRQLLNVLHVIHLYNRIKAGEDIVPRTVLIGGKAAPGYYMAKQIIRLTSAVAEMVNLDPSVKGKLKLLFLENYRVSLAERIFPASDLSEQISTAGKEASGTGNMKFSLNGALTIGTLDGANVEILEEVEEDNIFIFGLTVEKVQALVRQGYRPREYYEANPALREVIDLIATGFFSPGDPRRFDSLVKHLLEVDDYLILADFQSYIDKQEEVSELYRDQEEWTRKAILNVARMGKFSSDRTIREYNDEVWKSKTVSVDVQHCSGEKA